MNTPEKKTKQQIAFKKTIRTFYKKHGRHDLPWRKTRNPYKILVSEIMLQQTQVPRVLIKYKSFLQKFPSVQALASASLRDVLAEWQGLGYNRRGLYLKRCAEQIIAPVSNGGFGGVWPRDFKTLCSLPGIGPATAGDLLAFAWNIAVSGQPVIETNIRAVFIHFFFLESANGKTAKVSDSDILPLIEKTLDRKNPREWYFALFDYGAYLKSSQAKVRGIVTTNPSRRSAHHVRQSRFQGSNRQKRAEILRLVLEKPRTEKEITKILQQDKNIIKTILQKMYKEHLISKNKIYYYIQ